MPGRRCDACVSRSPATVLVPGMRTVDAQRRTIPRPPRWHSFSGRICPVGPPPSSEKPLNTSSSSMTSPKSTHPRAAMPAPSRSIHSDRSPCAAAACPARGPDPVGPPAHVAHDMAFTSTRVKPSLKPVYPPATTVAASPVFGHPPGVAHEHPFLAGYVATVPPGAAGRVRDHGEAPSRRSGRPTPPARPPAPRSTGCPRRAIRFSRRSSRPAARAR